MRSRSTTPRPYGIKPLDNRRHLSKEDKHMLRTMTIEEKDIVLIKEYFEVFKGNIHVFV